MNHREMEIYINNEDTGQHSPLGASSAKRYLSCPGSINLSAKCKKPKTSSFAMEGTRCHRCCELVMKKEIEPWELVGIKNVDNEMVNAVTFYENQILTKILKSNGKIEIEKEFHLKYIDEKAWGTCDCVIINPGELHVIDLKYGKGILVEVSEENPDDASGLDSDIPNNPQLLFYALGVYMSLTPSEQTKINSIYIWVIQPRAAHIDGPIRYAVTTKDKLIEFGGILKAGIKATKNPSAPLHINSECRFCPAFCQCPEQGKLTIADAKKDFADPRIDLPEPRQLKPKDIATILINKPILESWFKSIYEYAKIEMQSGLDIPGMKLVNGRGSRTWVNETQAVIFLKEYAYEKKLISVAQAEKLMKKLPENLVRKILGGPIIVDANDKRKCYIPEPITDFSNSF